MLQDEPRPNVNRLKLVTRLKRELEEFDERGIGGMLGSWSNSFQRFKSCLDTFGVGDISVEAAYF